MGFLFKTQKEYEAERQAQPPELGPRDWERRMEEQDTIVGQLAEEERQAYAAYQDATGDATTVQSARRRLKEAQDAAQILEDRLHEAGYSNRTVLRQAVANELFAEELAAQRQAEQQLAKLLEKAKKPLEELAELQREIDALSRDCYTRWPLDKVIGGHKLIALRIGFDVKSWIIELMKG